MHSIRSKARHAAWKQEDGPNYNPFVFGKPINRTRSREIDDGGEEGTGTTYSSQLRGHQQRTHSEACAIPETEIERHVDYTQGNGDMHGPKHANTMPTSPTSSLEQPQRFDQSPKEIDGFSRTDTQLSTAREPQGKMRKRDKLAFWKKSEPEAGQKPSRSSTKNSQHKNKKFTLWGQLRATIFGSWINLLLICVPVGIGLHFAKVNGTAVFVVNFLAIVPLAGLLSYSTEEIAMRVGETLGGLLNASFGNAVELIVSIIALFNHEVIIVKTSLIGSMLSNLLLVLGMCFFCGGIGRQEQHFNITVAQTASSLLALAVGSIIIPTIFLSWSDAANSNRITPQEEGHRINELSRGTAVVLLFVYCCYLYFQLSTHKDMYNEPSQKVPKKKSPKKEGQVNKGMAMIVAGSAATSGGGANQENHVEKGEAENEEVEEPNLSVVGAIVSLCIATAFTGWCAEYMVQGISSVTQGGTVSPEFIGLILIPIVGNAAEHATAVTVAIKDKMDLAIGVAVGSSMQIALLILPFVVVVAWIAGVEEMNLDFDGFQLALLFVAVLLVNYLIGDGKSHWLEGVLLMSTYIIIATAAWFYPADPSVIG